MRKYWPAVVLCVAASTQVLAQQQPAQSGAPAAPAAAVEAAVGTSIAERQLAGAGESFPAGTAKLYCFTKVSNAADSELEHVWFKGDVEQGRVTLKIGGDPWRTWSSKTLGPDAAGDWRCDVMKDGAVLQSVRFKVE
jgi:DUF2914 family protein